MTGKAYTLQVSFATDSGGGELGAITMPIMPRRGDEIWVEGSFYQVTGVRFSTKGKNGIYHCDDIEVWVNRID